MKKFPLLLVLLAAVVFVSGCSQATTVIEAANKLKATESAGYSANYTVKFQLGTNDKVKEAAQKDPASIGGLGILSQMPPTIFNAYGAKKSAKEKAVVDISTITSLLPQSSEGQFPIKTISIYLDTSTTDTAVCLEMLENKTQACTQGNINSISQKSPKFKDQLESFQQLSQQSPEKMLDQFKKLYDKGVLKLDQQTKKTIIGRECDEISFTISDISKLDSKDLLSYLGPFQTLFTGAAQISQQDLTQLSFLIQQMIKEIKQDLCLDKQYGLPLSASYSTEIDLSAVGKLASQFGGSQPQNKFPEGSGLIISISTSVNSLKTPIEDSEFNLPKDAIVESLESKILAEQSG